MRWRDSITKHAKWMEKTDDRGAHPHMIWVRTPDLTIRRQSALPLESLHYSAVQVLAMPTS